MNDIWQRKPSGLVLGLDFSGSRKDSCDGKVATLVGNATVAAGTQYLTLDGTGDRVTFADTNDHSFVPHGPFSAVMWLRHSSVAATAYCIMSKPNEWSLWTKVSGLSPVTGPGIRKMNNGDAGGRIYGMATAPLLANVTYCVAFTQTSSDSGVAIYIDGVSQAITSRDYGPTYSGMTNQANALTIGSASNSADSSPFAGTIYKVLLYNRALAAAEVAQIYNAGAARLALGGTP